MKRRLPLCRLGRASGLFARVHRKEDGFSLIEAVAAILIVMIFMAASAASLISGYRAVRQTKYFQQGTALGNRAIEETRDISYDALGMLNSDLAGDADIIPNCPPPVGPGYDPGPDLNCERIVSSDGNVEITNHIQTVPVEGKVFTIRRYVTWVDTENQGGPEQDYKRVSVVVEWTDNGTTDSFETSTFVSRARRGLPVPKFELTPASQTKYVEQGFTATFAHSIENLGIVDAYDIEMPVPAGWGIEFYADDQVSGQSGVYDSLYDEALTDTNGNGTPDTGNVATSEVSFFLAVVTVPVTQPNGGVDVPLTATSGVNDEVIGTSANRAGVGPVSIALYLHHSPSPPVENAAAPGLNVMRMNTTVPTAATGPFRYSNNIYNPPPLPPAPPSAATYPGRYLVRQPTTPLVDQTDSGPGGAGKVVNWLYPVPTDAKFQGNGSVKLWLASHNQNCDAVSLHYYIRRKDAANSNTAGTTTLLSQGDMTVSPGGTAPCAFTPVTVLFTIPDPGVTIPTNNVIELKVVVNSAAGTSAPANNALIMYDTTAYPSRLIMPQVTL